MVTLAEVKNLKVAELKDELKARGLEVGGTKPVLAARLEEALQTGVSADSDVPASASAAAPASLTAAATPAAAAEPEHTPAVGLIEMTADPTSAAQNGTASAAADGKPTPVEATVLSEDEKRKQRASRFGMPASQEEKKAARAARFGLPGEAKTGDGKAAAGVSNGITPLSQADKAAADEKLKERAKRFNLPLTLSKEEVEKQKKARLERFSSATTGTTTNGGISSVKGDDSADIQAKLAARAQRFALSGNASQKSSKPAEPVKPEEPKKPLDPEAEAKRKAREIKFVAK